MTLQTTLFSSSVLAAVSFAVGAAVPAVAQAKDTSATATTGGYEITLKVLPPEGFTGDEAPMVKDGGAAPNQVDGSENPNHHLVAFVKKDGNPVEHADVTIRYRKATAKDGRPGKWQDLHVVRMHEAGKSLATTHYGNNVHLASSEYDVRVAVNDSKPASFDVKL